MRTVFGHDRIEILEGDKVEVRQDVSKFLVEGQTLGAQIPTKLRFGHAYGRFKLTFETGQNKRNHCESHAKSL
jgi:hypothetical protein